MDLCVSNYFFLSKNFFKHKGLRSSVRNFRVYRGAKIHNDHDLVKVEFRVKLKKGGRKIKNKENQQLIIKSSRILMLSKNISCSYETRLKYSKIMRKMKKPCDKGSRLW